MLVFEFKTYGNKSQFTAVDEAIRTAKFVRNSCLRYWMDNKKVDKYDLNKYCAVLAGDFRFASELNSQAETCPVPNEHGLLSPDSTKTARKGFLVKKGIHNSRKTVALLSINQLDGNWLKIENQSNLPTRKELGN